jgi:hypothetical protein
LFDGDGLLIHGVNVARRAIPRQTGARGLWLYNSFEAMSAPGEHDADPVEEYEPEIAGSGALTS